MQRNCTPKKRRQRGYAAVLTLVLFSVMGLAVLSMYDVGQVSAEKVRLQNTADAAAYSTATMLARDYNFIAYTNRAMIANQVVIGQMVGLASWSAHVKRLATNINMIGQFANLIPGVGQFIARLTQALQQGAEMMHRVVDVVARVVVEATDLVITGLRGSQFAYHSLSLAFSQSLLTAVVEANDPDVDVGAASHAMFWTSFHRAWLESVHLNDPDLTGNSQARQFKRNRFSEFTQLVRDSRDRFSFKRNNRWLKLGIRYWREIEARKYGGSEFEMYERQRRLAWDWTAMDTESIHSRSWRWRSFGSSGWSSWKERVPLGWGAAHVLDRVQTGRYYNYAQSPNCRWWGCWGRDTSRWGEGAWKNRNAARLAQVEWGTNKIASAGGLQSYYDFSRDRDPRFNRRLRPGDTSVMPGLLIYLTKPAAAVNTYETNVSTNPQYKVADRFDVGAHGGMAADRISAVAKAEPYFSRPSNLWPKVQRWRTLSPAISRKYLGRREYGNLYNPYWQVRLVEPDSSEWAAAMVASGVSAAGF